MVYAFLRTRPILPSQDVASEWRIELYRRWEDELNSDSLSTPAAKCIWSSVPREDHETRRGTMRHAGRESRINEYTF